jgi:hypothetical protein
VFDLKDSINELSRILVEKDRREFESQLRSLKNSIIFHVEGITPIIYVPSLQQNIKATDISESFNGTFDFESTTSRTDLPLLNLGLGIKYFPWDKTFINISCYPSIQQAVKIRHHLTASWGPYPISSQTNNFTITVNQGNTVIGDIGHVFALNERARVSFFGGMLFSSLKYKCPFSYGYMAEDINGYDVIGFGFSPNQQKESTLSLYTAGLGFEYMVQKRLSIELIGRYCYGQLSDFDLQTNAYYDLGFRGPPSIPIKAADPVINQIVGSVVISLYF